MIKPSKLIFIRHAPIAKVQGFIPENDPSAIIDDKSFKHLSKFVPKDSLWYISPLRRTFETAQALSRYVKPGKMIIDNELIEQNFGDWTGKKVSKVWEEIKLEKSKHNFSFICPEVSPPNGDSFLDQCKRISSWIEKLELFKLQSVVVITHAGTIRAALSHILGIDPDKAIGIEILHLSMTSFEFLEKSQNKFRGGRLRLLGVNCLKI